MGLRTYEDQGLSVPSRVPFALISSRAWRPSAVGLFSRFSSQRLPAELRRPSRSPSSSQRRASARTWPRSRPRSPSSAARNSGTVERPTSAARSRWSPGSTSRQAPIPARGRACPSSGGSRRPTPSCSWSTASRGAAPSTPPWRVSICATWSAAAGWRRGGFELRCQGRNLSDQRAPAGESELGDAQYYLVPARTIELGASWSF